MPIPNPGIAISSIRISSMITETSSTSAVTGSIPASQAPPPAAPVAEATLSDSLATLRKRKMVVLAAVLIGLLIGIYKSLTQIKLYDASGRIQVRSGSSNEFKLSAAGTLGDDPQRKMLTEVSIITSDTLLVAVARDLNLADNATFLQSKVALPHQTLDEPSVRASVISTLKQNLTVALVPKTDIIRIGYSSLSPELSRDIVNRVIHDYIQRSYETRFESTQQVSRWLSTRLGDLKQEVEDSQNQVIDLQKRLGTLGFDSTHNQISSSLDDLARAAGVAKLARILAESRYHLILNMDPNAIESSIDTANGQSQPTLNNLRAQLAGASANLAQLKANLGPNHPEVLASSAQVAELRREVEAEQNRLMNQAHEALLLAQANEAQTSAALEQEKADAYRLRDDLVNYSIRQRDYESKSKLYEEMVEKLRMAGISAGLESLEIDIVDTAVIPATPTMVPRSTIVLTVTAIGLLAGVILAFLLESLDTGLRSVAELEALTELPSLAIVPRARRSTAEQLAAMSPVERNLNVLTQPKSQFTEAFRSLRTALLLSTVGREPKFILFTSATPAEGKTTTSTNLAVILSQRGTRVLLIDADLRRPNVHHRFGLNGKLGLSTVLSGQTRLEDSVQSVRELPGLDILASGPVPPFPSEMLSSTVMEQLLQHAGELYTHVVIDSPPILSVTDGVLLSRMVDAVVLVIRHGKSSKHIIRRSRDLLARSGAPLAGIVLNAVDLNAPEYYGYYGYSTYSYSSLDPAGWDVQGAAGKASRKDSR